MHVRIHCELLSVRRLTSVPTAAVLNTAAAGLKTEQLILHLMTPAAQTQLKEQHTHTFGNFSSSSLKVSCPWRPRFFLASISACNRAASIGLTPREATQPISLSLWAAVACD